MKNKSVVITGIGVISPFGAGNDAFWRGLEEGKSGIGPISLFDVSEFRAKTAAECRDFKPQDFLGPKGLRNMDRMSKLLCCGVKLALDDARIEITEGNADDIGIVTATTISIASDLAVFTKQKVDDGPRFVNPALFPPTTMNFPSSQASIRFKIKALNTTISTGYTAGLDAIKYGKDMIQADRAKVVLACGAESIAFSSFYGFYKIGFLAGLKGKEISCPFDMRHNGIILGEGAAVIVLEDEKYAKKRGARIYAAVRSVEHSFDAFRAVKYDPKASGLRQSMGRALKQANLAGEDIDYISASANSVPQQDALETFAIRSVFDGNSAKIPVSSLKSMLGESVSASGCLQVAAAIGAMTRGFIPPTINYQDPDPRCNLDYVPNTSRKSGLKNVLINNFGPGGNNASAILSKYGS